jgi:YHS domain-containing protein
MTAIRPTTSILLLGLALACDTTTASRATSAPQPSADVSVSNAPARQASERSSDTSSSLTLVTDSSLVCMVNNQFMGRPQIPVEVDGRTYYGCCEMCEGRLRNDSASRSALDPVSGNAVDKATAVIGRTRDGRTFYFENDRTFMAYESRLGG